MNRLQLESSPYLRQHAANPVDWYAWGEEALGKARRENKPVLVSIGYSTCHWCHVMERESFEDPEVAALMNHYFINIKIDREERPDLDQLYMDACQALTGTGGWPLNVFLTPEGKPFLPGPTSPHNRVLSVCPGYRPWNMPPIIFTKTGKPSTGKRSELPVPCFARSS
ncbi:MAG: thioredoxin domain-containing protein [Haliscomenobacter sp.]|nr:thioredoxin domain-containing protein [Haliscomenobacter sp.]